MTLYDKPKLIRPWSDKKKKTWSCWPFLVVWAAVRNGFWLSKEANDVSDDGDYELLVYCARQCTRQCSLRASHLHKHFINCFHYHWYIHTTTCWGWRCSKMFSQILITSKLTENEKNTIVSHCVKRLLVNLKPLCERQSRTICRRLESISWFSGALGVISDKYARPLSDRPVIKVTFVKCEKPGLDT